MSETFTCKTCGKDKPRREGRVFDTWLGECRKCRHTTYMKQYMQTRRDNDRLMAELVKRNLDAPHVGRTTSAQPGKAERAILKILKSQYLKATAVTRTRIAQMERNREPNQRTVKALEVRRRLLSRYEAAYKCQVEEAERGGRPRHIEDLVQE